ncbi:IS3 family transposase [Streptomyces sp. NBC_01615]|uniref:IS3 family transposase n=1 Tax=Streptomyces sp. NBC_01615 TaxID=2975898 RepID=UPI003862F215
MSEICRFIRAEKANYTVVLLCKAMKTARSTYYAWVAGAEAREARRRADEALAHGITLIHIASRRNYGVPRVTAELRRQGRPVNRKRVARVMREHGIPGNSRHTGRRSLTKADTKAAPPPDLIGRDFTATRPRTKIVGDITYIPTAEGWLTSPRGWTWPRARSSGTRWPTTIALNSSSTPWTWPPGWAAWNPAA